MRVLGTAGHIDHGKSSLVERLTGVNPDRLAEERRRGMTIELGFASFRLPSGDMVGVVDVPGHERFVRTMVAGAAGIDMALIAVSADEGVMPQTREHVDILRLLDVRSGVVAITKTDLADAELVEMVEDEIRHLLFDTPLRDSAVVPVSSVTGTGFPELLTAIQRAVASDAAMLRGATPYLPVDRVFTLVGHGTVVTGTLHGGQLRAGSKVEIVPERRQTRVRAIQVHGDPVEVAQAGSRVALNLAAGKDEVRRGDIIALPDSIAATHRFDGSVYVLPDATIPLRHGMEVTLHVGAAERVAKVSLVGEAELLPGESGWVRLRCDEPLPLVHGIRFILRLPSPGRTIAGGQVLDAAPRLQPRDARLVPRLEALRSSSELQKLQALLPLRHPRTPSELAASVGITSEQAQHTLHQLESIEAAKRLGDGYISSSGWLELRTSLLAELRVFSEKHPMKAGMPKEEARARLRLLPSAWAAFLSQLVAQQDVLDLGVDITLPGRQSGVSLHRDEADRILQTLEQGWFSPPNRAQLLVSANAGGMVLDALSDEGTVVKLNEDVFLLRSAYDAMTRAVVQLIQDRGSATVAEVRDALGVSRKYALAITEHLDSVHVTKRVGDTRVLGRRASQCA